MVWAGLPRLGAWRYKSLMRAIPLTPDQIADELMEHLASGRPNDSIRARLLETIEAFGDFRASQMREWAAVEAERHLQGRYAEVGYGIRHLALRRGGPPRA